MTSARARQVEQEEQILALLEAKRQDGLRAQEDVQVLQKKIEDLSSQRQTDILMKDEVEREKERVQRVSLKQRKQLKIEAGHGEELRGLVVEMLGQAE